MPLRILRIACLQGRESFLITRCTADDPDGKGRAKLGETDALWAKAQRGFEIAFGLALPRLGQFRHGLRKPPDSVSSPLDRVLTALRGRKYRPAAWCRATLARENSGQKLELCPLAPNWCAKVFVII
jgi:hypothetical protein